MKKNQARKPAGSIAATTPPQASSDDGFCLKQKLEATFSFEWILARVVPNIQAILEQHGLELLQPEYRIAYPDGRVFDLADLKLIFECRKTQPLVASPAPAEPDQNQDQRKQLDLLGLGLQDD